MLANISLLVSVSFISGRFRAAAASDEEIYCLP